MIEIKKMTLDDDLHSILQLLDQLSSVTKSSMIDNKMKSIIHNPNHNYYIMTKNGTIIGISCLFIRETLCHDCKSVGYIEDIVIDKTERGNGYGKKLVNYLVNEAKENSCYKVILQCDPKLKHFYESCRLTQKNIIMSLYFD